MAKGNGKEKQRSSGGERAFRLTTYYKIVTIFTILAALGYGALYVARQQGYQLINTSTLFWLFYALIIGVILLVGKFIVNLPKSESTRRSMRISVGIVTVLTIFVMYVNVVSQLDSSLHKYATLKSPDGKHTVIVMQANIKIAATKTEEAKVYTAYTAYPKINRYFCDSSGDPDVILLLDDQNAVLNKEWTDNGLILSTDSEAAQGDNTINLTFD